MSLILYNTLKRDKEPFTPINPDRVMMYCCGVTVYDDCHLGHARSYMVWDVLRRYLQWRGYRVHYVQIRAELQAAGITVIDRPGGKTEWHRA